MRERKDKILEYMKELTYKPLSLSELVTVLGVPSDETGVIDVVLQELIEEGKIIKTKKGKFGLPEKMNLIIGKLRGNERGYAFLLSDDVTKKDVFIPAEGMNGAMDSDTVVVRLSKSALGDRRAEGEVIRILKRGYKTVVGIFERSRNFAFVVPDNSRISGDIFISKDDYNGAKNGQSVVVEITAYQQNRRNAEGRVIEVIGDKNAPGTDIKSIIRAYNLEEEFPEKVITQIEDIKETVEPHMIQGRKDLRSLKMVTIDGEDARDLDDAVSVEKTDNGYRLGVHIADVAHYVRENTPLDKEALNRGTSVYLVDRVIPMLPRVLSNGICSLNPQVDRLAMTVFMDIDYSGKVLNHEIYESVINVNERMTYKNVYKILKENDPELKERYKDFIDFFFLMEELALILRNKRSQRGAIDFDFAESKVILDDVGRPIDVKKYEITIANQIIEEFMLVCNETVAEHFFWANVPFVYRIHEEPDTKRIEAFAEFAYNMGYVLKGVNKIHPRSLQQLLESAKGKKEERIISTVMLRSLKKARYTSENDIHFGLAAKYYSHFTSPIRRYPDLMIHRIIKDYLHGKITPEKDERLRTMLPEITRLCSERERDAEEAERETVDLKKVEYMKAYVGKTFEGIISGVTNFGMFIELENTIEGLVRLGNMEDDYYIYDEKHLLLMGERTRKTYRIGDVVNVILARADTSDRKIEFVLDE